ncbi:MAG: porin [Sediminibacterium sp.]
MKNKLVQSLLLSSIAFSANSAEPLKIKLGGRLDTMYGSIKESSNYRNTNPTNPISGNQLSKAGIVNDTRIDINIDGKHGKEIKYGGFIALHADSSTATNGEKSIGDKTMVYLQHDQIGRIEVGNMPGGHALFEMDTANFNKGTWGIDGFWSKSLSDRTMRTSEIYNKKALPVVIQGEFVGLTDLVTVSDKKIIPQTSGIEYIISPNLLSNASGHYYSDAPKVNLFTKPLKQVTVAFTYIPDMDSHGSIAGMANRKGPIDTNEREDHPGTFKNIVGLGLMVEEKIEKFNIKASIAGETGKAKLPKYRDLKAYEGSLMITYNGISVGGTYGSWGKSMTSKNPVANAKQGSQYWTGGIGQQIDKFGYSITYMQSKKAGGLEILYSKLTDKGVNNFYSRSDFSDTSHNKFSNIVFDIDYQLAPGFLVYTGLSKFKFKESKGSSNKGRVLLLGTRLIF